MSAAGIKIAVDAMGSDNWPLPEVGFLRDGVPERVHPVLVGNESVILERAEAEGINANRFSIVHAPERIGMDESPLSVRTRKDSSIVTALNLLKSGEVDAVVSAGNTGAVMAAAVFILGRLPGISRPAIAGWIPTTRGFALVLDLGANVDCRSEHLVDFALMGEALFRILTNSQSPRIGLLSNGEEDTKGNALVKSTRELLKASALNFVGNVEGKDIFFDKADVVVCDGFVGNILLKGCEGLAEFMTSFIKQEIRRRPLALLGALGMRGVFKRMKRRFDYAEYGGAPLVGVNGIVIVTHGRADERAVRNAVLLARRLVEADYIGQLKEAVSRYKSVSRPSLGDAEG